MEKSKSFPKYSSSSGSGEFGGFEGPSSSSYNFNGKGSGGAGGGFSASADPELQRKRRIASYNVFNMENKVKSSVKNSFKWIKTKFTDIRYGL